MKISKKFVLLLMVAVLSGALSMSAYAKVITYASGNTATKMATEKTGAVSSKNSKTTESYGPGYVSQSEAEIEIEEENVTFQGPSVKKVSLYETYYELYDTYEESIADTYFLYANVSNGGLTHEPVSIDIPANVEYTMEKDGIPIPYVSKQLVGEKGTYVLRLTAIEDPGLPFSEQTEYQAVFRFRIQDEPPETEEETNAEEISYGGSTSGSIWDNNALDMIPSDMQVDISKLIDDTTQAETEAVVVETTPAETEEEIPEETETVQEETTPVETSESIETDAEETLVSETIASGTRQQTFDPETGFYTIVLENGMKMMTNVEDGYKGEGPIQFTVAEEDLSMTALYRGSERITLNKNSRTITEHGKYQIAMANEDGEISSIVVTIPYQMNFYAVLAIVLCVLVVVGLGVFVIVTKKNFKIR